MFEEKAEEIMRQNGCRTHSGNFIQANKVCELIQKGIEYGYNKANEWHYMKDVKSYDDLPQETVGKVFIWKVKTRDFNGFRSGSWGDLWFDMNGAKVFCYKEIVPPKEEE